ncbi:MAG: DegT/DnrJ/EryC1/StrS family aminotransferase [Lachnospiraceae bacterium]|nr:DegT/DnrJ/EryC1/StrS family aminotransferase [Lachnospiraceae bacterium]
MKMQEKIPLFKVYMAEEIDKPLLDVIHSGWIGEGPKVVEFENNLKEYFGNPYLSTVNNGTSALHLAYHMSLHPNDAKSYYNNNQDEIISTAITCTATNTPIITNGAKIVWADVDPITGNIDPADIERKITKNTKAIAMVHWGGNPCLINEINEIAQKYNIKTIEDAAHGIGMEYGGKKVGNFSDYTAISLQAIKSITSVDGGILMMKNETDYNRACLLRWYGIDRTHKEGIDLRCELDVEEAGYKFHMNDVMATIGNVNFQHIDEIIGKYRENAAFYNEVFKDNDKIITVPENPLGKSSYWLYTIHVPNRDHVMQKLNEAGIMSSKVHARNDIHSMFKEFKTDLPNTEKFNTTHLCIPVGWWVTKEQREYIAEKVIEIVN